MTETVKTLVGALMALFWAWMLYFMSTSLLNVDYSWSSAIIGFFQGVGGALCFMLTTESLKE